MFRYLERSENAARLIDVGFRIALTRSASADQEWTSILQTVDAKDAYDASYDAYGAGSVINFLLRDRNHAGSVLSMAEAARNNAREVRTALTREVFEATNESYLTLKDILARPVSERDLPGVLDIVRKQSALVRGAMYGTMLRNDIYSFAQLGTFLERADNTARILDVKYYVLLPSMAHVGAAIDNVQWETILRAVSALQAYRWLSTEEVSANGIGKFLILDQRLPRSLAFCSAAMKESLEDLALAYGVRGSAVVMANRNHASLTSHTLETIIEEGLHETLETFIGQNSALAVQIEQDFRFYE